MIQKNFDPKVMLFPLKNVKYYIFVKNGVIFVIVFKKKIFIVFIY